MGIVIPLSPFFLRELGMTDRAALERWSEQCRLMDSAANDASTDAPPPATR